MTTLLVLAAAHSSLGDFFAFMFLCAIISAMAAL